MHVFYLPRLLVPIIGRTWLEISSNRDSNISVKTWIINELKTVYFCIYLQTTFLQTTLYCNFIHGCMNCLIRGRLGLEHWSEQKTTSSFFCTDRNFRMRNAALNYRSVNFVQTFDSPSPFWSGPRMVTLWSGPRMVTFCSGPRMITFCSGPRMITFRSVSPWLYHFGYFMNQSE